MTEPSEQQDRKRNNQPLTTLGEWLRNPLFWAAVSAIVLIPVLRGYLRHVPDPPPVISRVPEFQLVNQAGEEFGSEELSGHVYITSFIFTRCQSACPLITAGMRRLQDAFDRNELDIKLLSISVDPENDSPQRLRAYAQKHEAQLDDWTFLTGDLESIRTLAIDGFKMPVGERQEPSQGLVEIAHSSKLILVDQSGHIRGYYDSDEEGLDKAFHYSRRVLWSEDG